MEWERGQEMGEMDESRNVGVYVYACTLLESRNVGVCICVCMHTVCMRVEHKSYMNLQVRMRRPASKLPVSISM
jgi:hypothetical protein